MKKAFLRIMLILLIQCSAWAQLPANRLDSLIHTTFHKTLRAGPFLGEDDLPPIQYYFVKFITGHDKQPSRWVAPANSSLVQFQAFENSFTALFEAIKANPKRYPLEPDMVYLIPIKVTRMDEPTTQVHISPKKFNEMYTDLIGAIESNSKLHGKVILIEWIDVKVYPPMK